MFQEARLFWKWLQHDRSGKVLFNVSLFLLFWAKWSIYRYVVCYWFGDLYIPEYSSSFLGVAPQLNNTGVIIEYVYKILFILATSSFVRAAFGDPGYVHLMRLRTPKGLLPELPEKLEKKCIKCNNLWKPPRAHHCKTCKQCVLRMDHHCMWVGNCVGAKNQKFFMLFLFYTLLYSVMTIGLCVVNLIFWLNTMNKSTKWSTGFNDGWGTANRILLAIFGVFFLFFTLDFLSEQWESVKENQTTVETYKEMVGRPRPFMRNLEKVFGTNTWAWLLPIAPNLRINALEMLYHEAEVTGDKEGEDTYDEDEFVNNPMYEKYFI